MQSLTHSNQKAVFIHPKWCSFEPVSKLNSESVSTSYLTTNYEKLFEIITSAIIICAFFVEVTSFTPSNRNKLSWAMSPHLVSGGHFFVWRRGLDLKFIYTIKKIKEKCLYYTPVSELIWFKESSLFDMAHSISYGPYGRRTHWI